MHFLVDFEPVGRRVAGSAGATLLDAAQRAGVALTATCGGEGVCGRCIVQVMAGQVSSPNLTETTELEDSELAAGWRLACQTTLHSDVRLHIPPESLATAQRTQTEGRALEIQLDPAVRAYTVALNAPTLQDLRSDADRLRDALAQPQLTCDLAVLRDIPNDLRVNDFQVSAFVRGERLVAVRPAGAVPLGLACDIGTTKLAAYLVELESGKTLAAAGAMNPQIAFGEDVMARLGHAISRSHGGEQLRSAITEAINRLARDLCAQSGRQLLDIAEAVLVGNTAMHHLLLGLPVKQLGLAPYVPAESAALDLPAGELGLELASGAMAHLLPNIAGFVGADHVAMLLAARLADQAGVVLGMDIGTNTEISLVAGGRHFACSTASGPAFEGAHIRHGMRAAPGAIEKVILRGEQVIYQTVDNAPPVGICGSGILDLVAQLLRAGIINARGAMLLNKENPRLRQGEVGVEFVVVPSLTLALSLRERAKDISPPPAGEGPGVREIAITFSRADVNEIQLAKGAIRAGINILLRRAGVKEQDIQNVIIAGAFGTYLDLQSGIDISMFPRLPKQRFTQVGNAAGAGARMALLSLAHRARAAQIARQVEYIELTAEKDFASVFAKALLFG
jgi:uncharacterized 2Fe-2S/4Fe-4S cluster protein (DUF4445 family)